MPNDDNSFQALILRLQQYWSSQGCVLLQPYDMEMGAGTFHPAPRCERSGRSPGARRMCSPAAGRPTAAMGKTPTGCSITTNIR